MKNTARLAGFVLVVVTSACTHVFYAPSRDRIMEPRDEGYAYDEVALRTEDGVELGAWLFPPQPVNVALSDIQGPRPPHPPRRMSLGTTFRGSPRATVIHFHGNAENISTFYQASAWLAREGYEVLTVDYRGYGASSGEPSQPGLNQDAVAALRWGQARCHSGASPGLVVFAQSLGGAVALRALHDFKPRCLRAVIIDSSFGDYHRIAAEKLRSTFLTWPFQWLAYLLVSNGYGPEAHMAELAPTPLLFVHGTADDVVPLHHGRKLFDAAREPKTFWEIPDGHHIDAFTTRGAEYRPRLLSWLSALFKTEARNKR